MSSDDFLTVLGSMPKFDNDGVLITNSSLGSGGSRRSNGTLSKMVENLQIVSDDETDNGWDVGALALTAGAGLFIGACARVFWVRVVRPKINSSTSPIKDNRDISSASETEDSTESSAQLKADDE